MRPTVSVQPVHWRMVPVIVIVVIIISVMVIVAAAAATAAAYLPTVAGAGATPPLPYGLRVTWGIVSTVPHEIRIQNYDPQSTLSLLDGVVATCEEGTRDNNKSQRIPMLEEKGTIQKYPSINGFLPQPWPTTMLIPSCPTHLVRKLSVLRRVARSARDRQGGENSSPDRPRGPTRETRIAMGKCAAAAP